MLFYPTGDEGFSPLFMAGIFMLLTHTTTLSLWSNSYFLRKVKIIYYCGIYFHSCWCKELDTWLLFVSIPVIHNVKIRTLHKKHLLPLSQTLKVFTYVHILGHWFAGKTQLGSQKSEQKAEPICINLILSGHLHEEGCELAVEPTHFKPSANSSFVFIMLIWQKQ